MFNRNIASPSRLVVGCLLAAAVVFTGNLSADERSGEPLLLAAVSDGFNPEQAFMATCNACHSTGAGGAPKMNDAEAWKMRMEKGMDAVMTNVINGLNAMPAKGLCFNCTDDDLKAVVEYMFAKSQGQ